MECWGAVDLDFLAKKFTQGWIQSIPTADAEISIHDLISARVVASESQLDSAALHARLLDCLRQLNPQLQSLHEFHGEDVELRNGVRYAKIGWMEGMPCRHSEKAGGKPSQSRNAFVRRGEHIFLTQLRIYADGEIDIHPQFDQEFLVSFESFQERVNSGEIAITVANNSVVQIDTLGSMRLVKVCDYVQSTADFISDVRDSICQLSGEESLVEKCRTAYQAYLGDPTVELRERLRKAYEAVPEHHRMYVGDMDTKDIAVRVIIYGEQELEGWSHRLVARSLGEEVLPSIEVPKPKDE